MSVSIRPATREDARMIAEAVAMTSKAHSEGHADVALIVDESNPAAERLYARLGFERVGMRMFFGHTMWYMCHRLSL